MLSLSRHPVMTSMLILCLAILGSASFYSHGYGAHALHRAPSLYYQHHIADDLLAEELASSRASERANKHDISYLRHQLHASRTRTEELESKLHRSEHTTTPSPKQLSTPKPEPPRTRHGAPCSMPCGSWLFPMLLLLSLGGIMPRITKPLLFFLAFSTVSPILMVLLAVVLNTLWFLAPFLLLISLFLLPALLSPCRRVACSAASRFPRDLAFMRIFHHCPSTPATPEGSVLPAAPLSRGAHGPGVAQLQAALIRLQLLHPSAVRHMAGLFGPLTEASIAKLRRDHLNDTSSSSSAACTGVYDDQVRTLLLGFLGALSDEQSASTAPVANTAAASPIATEVSAAQETPKTEPPAAPSVSAPEKVPSVGPASVDPELGVASSVETSRASYRAALAEMGFDASLIDQALEATEGSLQHATDWLFTHRLVEADSKVDQASAATPQVEACEVEFPVEWVGLLRELQEMGFEEHRAEQALRNSGGEVKAAVKMLVADERRKGSTATE